MYSRYNEWYIHQPVTKMCIRYRYSMFHSTANSAYKVSSKNVEYKSGVPGPMCVERDIVIKQSVPCMAL